MNGYASWKSYALRQLHQDALGAKNNRINVIRKTADVTLQDRTKCLELIIEC